MDLAQTLVAASSGNQNALGIIEQYTRTNYAEFMNLLATELATEGKDPFLRQLAGQTIRNNLYGKEETSQAEKHIRWKQTPVEARNPVKNALLAAMRSPLRQARHAAAQASSEIATLELPSNLWPEFLPAMLEYVTAEAHSEGTKVAALECLGYTCERIGEVDGLPTLAPDVTNAMLTTIVDGMQTSRSDPVRLAACKALRNSLVFTASNFEKKAERDAIINSICEATLSSDANIRKEAFGCIHTVAYLYYDKLQDYMSVFYELTIKAIRSDEESVATEALELWNVLAEIEEDLIIEEAEGTNAQPCHRYTFSILEHFVPILLEATAKQPEDFDLDADQYSLSVAAQTCLQLMAQTTGDAITPFVMPFVTNNIKNTNWRYREAATMAFAAILEGASEQSVKATVEQAISVLVAALNDNVEMVKHSTLWTLSKICELHSNSIPAAELPSLVNALMGKLAPPNSPHVAQQAAHALFKLASAFQGDPMGQERGSNLLSPFLQSLLQQLMAAADRTDALGESGLKLAAFEAMQEFIRVSAPDGKPLLLQLLPAINERLQMSFQMQTSETKDELQGHLSATLLTLCRKLDREDIAPLSDALMSNFLRVLQTPSHQSQEEALGAIAAVADATEEAFERYMSNLKDPLLAGLRQFDSHQVCITAVGLVGDICRGIGEKISPYTDDIMNALVESLKNASLHRSVKPVVLSCFGEIATAITSKFEPYMQISLMLLMQASAADADQADDEMIEYINLLRESIVEAYIGIINGLADGKRLDLMGPYMPSLFQFLHKIASDENRDEALVSKVIGLIGDIAREMGPAVKDMINQPFIASLLQEGIQSQEAEYVNLAQWAFGVVQNVVQS